MVQYARTDAHYLLYIANCLFAELKQQDCGMFAIQSFFGCWLLYLVCLEVDWKFGATDHDRKVLHKLVMVEIK